MATTTIITFYGWHTKKAQKTYWLSNFYYSPFIDNTGRDWGTSEAFFQAQKYEFDPLPSETPKNIKDRAAFVEDLRTHFQDAPHIVFKLTRATMRGGIGNRIGFMGINQPLMEYKSKEDKQEVLNTYIEEATIISRKFRLKTAPCLIDYISPTWTSDPLSPGGRIYAMARSIVYKFRSNTDLLQNLIDTYPSELQEVNPRDYYWGVGKDDSGKNILGELLMILRAIAIQDPNQELTLNECVFVLVCSAKETLEV